MLFITIIPSFSRATYYQAGGMPLVVNLMDKKGELVKSLKR